VLRYWHLRRLEPPGPLVDNMAWDSSFREAGLDELCALVGHYVHTTPLAVRPPLELSHVIERALDDARQVRLWTTTACAARQYRAPRCNQYDIPATALWPEMPLRLRGGGWRKGSHARYQYLLRIWQILETRRVASVVLRGLGHWARTARPSFAHRSDTPLVPLVFGQLSAARAMFRIWQPRRPLNLMLDNDGPCPDAVPLRLLLQQCRINGPDPKMNWKANLPWYLHYSTAGWAETLIYLRATQGVRPPPGLFGPETRGLRDQGPSPTLD
jgi:hypothetical protein